jgi:hypothetical protein
MGASGRRCGWTDVSSFWSGLAAHLILFSSSSWSLFISPSTSVADLGLVFISLSVRWMHAMLRASLLFHTYN